MDDDAAPDTPAEAGRDGAAPTDRQADGGAAAPIDLERLAEKVYRLLRDEVRQARARGGVRPAPWGR